VVTAYITGLVQDEDEEMEEIIEMIRGMLWDAKVSEEALESFIGRLTAYLETSSSGRQKARPTVHRLEKAIDMKTSGMSTTIALSGQVDLEHGGKSQVCQKEFDPGRGRSAKDVGVQASRVDVAKLAKAEAKIKVRS
jgi:ATP-binding cassette subfamily F protein 3